MPIASGNRVRLVYVPEVTRGTTPGTPSMKVLRATSRAINAQKNLLESEEIRESRQVFDVRHGFEQGGGSFGYELSLQSYDDMFESLAGGSWVAVNTTGSPDLGAVAATDHFSRSVGSFITDGFRPGDIIVTTGFTDPANNGQFRVTAVTATEVTVDGALVDEAAAAGRTLDLVGKRLDPGTALKTFTFERQFLDITQYQIFRGMLPSSATLQVRPERIAGGAFNVYGMSIAPATGTPLDANPDAAPGTKPMSAFDGELYEGGATQALVTGIDFNFDNQRGGEPVVGSKGSPDVFDGILQVTGTLTAFFQDMTLLNKFLNETESSLWLRLDDPDDDTAFFNIVIPRLKYTGGDIDPPPTGAAPKSMPFRGLEHPTYGHSVWFQRSNA